ncbi:MAG: hypothetical protein KJ077_17885 [Anaerolineae bacterium]|nr:hypothetical protein [Anaerolineae bacterium]
MLHNINRIEIWGKNQNEKGEWESYHFKTIEDLGQINSIVETFKTYADDWEYGQYYPYIPGRLTITFYAGKKPMTSIMIVSLTNTTRKNEQTSTYFLSKEYGPAKPITEAEFRELIEILEVDENLTLNP